MALFQWNENLSVHVAEIDGQHRKLIEMINDLHHAMQQGKGRAAMGRIIYGLMDYAATHFATEEKYFDQFGYPDAAVHKKEHSDFTKKAVDFRDKFERGDAGSSIELMNFLFDWLQNHIKRVDKKYGPFFNENGLK
jgi:hemerythrin